MSRKLHSKKFLIPVDSKEEGWTRFEWSGNGRAFLYSRNGFADKGAGIYERDLETGAERCVYNNPKRRVQFKGLKCSRDYKWLAFLDESEIMVVNLETAESHQAASEVDYPCWSPDGQKILAIRAYGGSKEHLKSLFVFPASGGPVKKFDLSQTLPKKSRINYQDWSPNGKQVVFGLSQGKGHVLLYKNVIPERK